eukprot:m.148659 g.148659  ORF g.148659 m.148659 type:complete len:54 (-) comp16283_c0_seq18:2037-2198(-)
MFWMISTAFQDGTVLKDILDSSYTITINGGNASISVANGLPRVLSVVSEVVYS